MTKHHRMKVTKHHLPLKFVVIPVRLFPGDLIVFRSDEERCKKFNIRPNSKGRVIKHRGKVVAVRAFRKRTQTIDIDYANIHYAEGIRRGRRKLLIDAF